MTNLDASLANDDPSISGIHWTKLKNLNKPISNSEFGAKEQPFSVVSPRL
jgi:hypothetical protein